MTVPEGAVYGFLGRNGSGKTTTIKMLLGLLKPSSGSALICGLDVAAERRYAASRLGGLLEGHGFYKRMSGLENLRMAQRLRGVDASEPARVLELVGMSSSAGKRVSDYSQGMRQRLGLARALLGAPPVLILDEPMNGLDPEGIAEMRQLLKALPDRAKTTVLISSHLLSEIEHTATHIGILSGGRLVLEGELADLKSRFGVNVVLRVNDVVAASRALHQYETIEKIGERKIVIQIRGRCPDKETLRIVEILNKSGCEIYEISQKQVSMGALFGRFAGSGYMS